MYQAEGEGGKAPAKKKTEPYVNPLRRATGIHLMRTDQGVDYFADAGSPILAIGRAEVTRADTNSGWPGGGVVHYKLLDGTHKGARIYVAEYIYPAVKVGEIVYAGQVVARFTRSASSGVGIEMGYLGHGTTWNPCASDKSGVETASGKAFARFLRSLGCHTLQDPGTGSSQSPCK